MLLLNVVCSQSIVQRTDAMQAWLQVPEQVTSAVQRYLASEKFPLADKSKNLERIMTYYEDDMCPFA